MRLTWLGWAGVELEADDGSTVVIDPLQDAPAVFAPLGDRSAGTPAPAVVAAAPGRAVAGLVTHLHLDHADAAALDAALAAGAPVFEPPAGGGGPLEELALVQAERALEATGRQRVRVAPWDAVAAGPFTLTALPAADGIGDPQVAWLAEADGVRVLHLGDTIWHGGFWRMALRHGPFDVVLVPVSGAVVSFPHRVPASPLPGMLDPVTAALVAETLGARLAIPIHGEGFDIDGVYRPVTGPEAAFLDAAAERGVPARRLGLGETLAVTAVPAVG